MNKKDQIQKKLNLIGSSKSKKKKSADIFLAIFFHSLKENYLSETFNQNNPEKNQNFK